MFDNDSAATTDALMAGIDVAIEAQLSWDQQLLRCSLLRESARDGMLRPNAHLLCQFGIWLSACHARLQQYDEPAVGRLFATHMAMHQAVSSMCENALAGSAAREQDLEAFRHQVSMRQRDPSARAATPSFDNCKCHRTLAIRFDGIGFQSPSHGIPRWFARAGWVQVWPYRGALALAATGHRNPKVLVQYLASRLDTGTITLNTGDTP